MDATSEMPAFRDAIAKATLDAVPARRADRVLATPEMRAIKDALNWIAYIRGESNLSRELALPPSVVAWVLS